MKELIVRLVGTRATNFDVFKTSYYKSFPYLLLLLPLLTLLLASCSCGGGGGETSH